MAPPTALDADALLHQLHHGRFAFARVRAAERLGQLSTSDESIVAALLASQAEDSAPVVRQAASLALSAAPHQAVLAHSAAQVDTAVAQARPALRGKQNEIATRVKTEFARRRRRELTSTLIFALVIVAWLASLFLRFSALVQIGYVLVMGMLAITFVFTRLNWKCPACEGNLSGRSANVSAVFCPSPLACPHCGTRLR